MEDVLIIQLIAIIFGVLNIVLLSRIFRATNDIRQIRDIIIAKELNSDNTKSQPSDRDWGLIIMGIIGVVLLCALLSAGY